MDEMNRKILEMQQYYCQNPIFRTSRQLIVPQSCGIARIQSYEEKMMEKFFESCLFKTTASFVMGYGLGAAIGLFSASVGPVDVKTQTQTMREVFAHMKTTTLWNARSFAKLGALFMIVECNIETYRGRSDWKNGTLAGGVTGALIGLKSGLKSGVVSACGFALFSTVVDYYLNHRE